MIPIDLALTLFLSLLLLSLPFLLLGVVVSSFLAVFVNQQKLVAIFPRDRILGAIVGSGLGLLLPVGQYGTIPIARRFLLQGVPPAVVFSFFVAAPTLNVFTLWLTWQAFVDRADILFYRSLWIGFMSMAIGTLFSFYREKLPTTEVPPLLLADRFFSPDRESQPLPKVDDLVDADKTPAVLRESWQISLPRFLDQVIRETLDFGGLLVLGCAMAAFCQLWLPQSPLLAWGQTPFSQTLVMILFGFTLSVNASLSTFVPGAPLTTLFSGSLLAYLLFSSLINLPSLGLLLFTFRPKIVLYLTILLFLLTLFASLTLSVHIG
jgi:uncharacterized membrane protein YraQ (UPF0718 family)